MGRGLDGFRSILSFVGRLCSFQGPTKGSRPPARVAHERARWSRKFGGTGVGETPLPIPNREVKPHSADGTCPLWGRESRSPPVFFIGIRAALWGGSTSLRAPRRRADPHPRRLGGGQTRTPGAWASGRPAPGAWALGRPGPRAARLVTAAARALRAAPGAAAARALRAAPGAAAARALRAAPGAAAARALRAAPG